MPRYDVVERHMIRIAAPADVTLNAACEQDLRSSVLIDGIFKLRELILGSKPDERSRSRGLLAVTRELGWGMLAEVPGREIVMGAICQPWLADVVFRPFAPDEFTGFREPGYVKIIWTLRADPLGPAAESIFRTETRAMATDGTARTKFRWYWAMVSPGVWLIRRLLLGPLRREAETRTGRSRVGEARNNPQTCES